MSGGELSERTRQFTNIESQLEDRDRELRETRRQLTNAEEQLQRKDEEVSSLESRLEEKVQQVDELEESLSVTRHAVNELSRQQSPDWVIPRDQIQLTEKCLGMGGWGSVIEGKIVAVLWLSNRCTSQFCLIITVNCLNEK